jgi:hypothetical protein
MQRAVPITSIQERGAARRTCVCIAAPVIASRSVVGKAVCDSTASTTLRRWRTATTQRSRVLYTTATKQVVGGATVVSIKSEQEPRRGSNSLLGATYGSLQDRLRPAHDRQGCTEYGVAHRKAKLLRPVLRSFDASLNESKRPIARAPHLRARRASLSAPVPANLGTLHNLAVRQDVRAS